MMNSQDNEQCEYSLVMLMIRHRTRLAAGKSSWNGPFVGDQSNQPPPLPCRR
jgi:hypothetical protein